MSKADKKWAKKSITMKNYLDHYNKAADSIDNSLDTINKKYAGKMIPYLMKYLLLESIK